MEPFLDDSGYVDRYVAYLDILGFSALTAKADTHPNWRAYLRQSIFALNATVPTHIEHIDFRFVQFSDSIVLSARRTPTGLAAVLQSCTMLFNNMLERDILLRGGIAAGNFHHDDRVMFGPALIRAYASDRKGAPPHIAISSEVVEDMKPSSWNGSLLPWICDDPWDLTPMLHTLINYANYDGVPREGTEAMDLAASRLAERLQHASSDRTMEPSARAKWRWLQVYWNKSVSEKGVLTRSEHHPDWNHVHEQVRIANQKRLAAYNMPPPIVRE